MECRPIKEEIESPAEIIWPDENDAINTIKNEITKQIIEEDCRKNKCQVNLYYKNGYRKLIAMVKNRTKSRNYTFDGYLNLHLQKARAIIDSIYTEEYNKDQLWLKEMKSLDRAEKLIWPGDTGIAEYKTPKKKIVASIDLTKTKEKKVTKRVVFDESEPISIMSISSETQEATHVSINTIRDEAISSIMPSQDSSADFPNCAEINTEEVLNQDYDRFDAIVLGRVQSTQNSVPVDFFDFSLNQEHDTDDIDWN